MPFPRIKICCIASIDEARLAVAYGASAVGLVAEMPSGPGPIPEPLLAEIAATVPPGVATFLLTSLQDPDAIIEQQRRCGANTLQLVDRLPPGSHRRLREALPGIKLVQVIHVTGPEAFDEAVSVATEVDALLLDSGDQRLAVKLLGGTGRTHDWSVSRRIRDEAGVPVFLAGGLNPVNVADAVRAVQPFGVDVCSGLRTDGRLDEAKLRAFVSALSGELRPTYGAPGE
jgi:phosphoribosylanthranilate isomerase